MRLDNNQQLYDYLVALGAKLNAREAVDLSRRRAGCQPDGSDNTRHRVLG
jgi:hypothetical protein